MAAEISPRILDYLKPLEAAVAELANTWRPDDPEYRADVYRQIMMQLSYSYFAFFHADPEHPDWAPLWNPVYTLQPNPDDIYLYCPISSEYQYRITGNRGTVKMVTMNTQAALSGMPGHVDHTGEFYADLDDGDLQIDSEGNFEVLLSTERPAGHTGNWLRIQPGAVLVLISRAHVVDFDALTELVLAGRFKAAIDVFPVEPLPLDHPIRRAPNAVLSGHRAGSVPEGLREIGAGPGGRLAATERSPTGPLKAGRHSRRSCREPFA